MLGVELWLAVEMGMGGRFWAMGKDGWTTVGGRGVWT